MRECCRQVEAEVVSKSKNKIHQTWGPPISRALYFSKLLRNEEAIGSWKAALRSENPVDTWREAALTSPNSLVFTLRAEGGKGERGME